MPILSRRTLCEVFLIFTVASILGFITNVIHPNRVKITIKRPQLVYAADTLFAHDLPTVGIQLNDTKPNSDTAPSDMPLVVTTKQAFQLFEKYELLFIDAREPAAYKKEHIQNAINLPLEDLDKYEDCVKSLPTHKYLICYCEGPPCDLGELLALELFNRGFKKAGCYLDGLNSWKKEGYPVAHEVDNE